MNLRPNIPDSDEPILQSMELQKKSLQYPNGRITINNPDGEGDDVPVPTFNTSKNNPYNSANLNEEEKDQRHKSISHFFQPVEEYEDEDSKVFKKAHGATPRHEKMQSM